MSDTSDLHAPSTIQQQGLAEAQARSEESRLRAEQFRKQVFLCLHAWRDWSIFGPQMFVDLETLFRRGTLEPVPKGSAEGTERAKVLKGSSGLTSSTVY